MFNSVNEIIQRRKDIAILKSIRLYFIKKMMIIALFILILFTQVIGVTNVRGVDMSPALKDGDIAIYVRLIKSYANGDIVVYKHNKKSYVSRVAAVSGDTLQKGTNGQIVFNERLHPINKDEGLYYKTMARNSINYPITLKKNELFVLGDKRDTAEDSRSFGLIKRNQVKGKIITFIRKRGL